MKRIVAGLACVFVAVWAAPEVGAAPEPLRIGIVTQNITVSSPSDILIAIEPLTRYLSEKIGRPLRSQVVETHHELLRLLKAGKLEIGYASDREYVIIKEEFPGVAPIAKPRKVTKSTLDVLMLTRPGEGKSDFRDLEGKRFACHNTFSSASYLLPQLMVKRAGFSDLGAFFSSVVKTSKEANSVYAVAFRKAEVAFVTDHVFDLVCELKPKMRRILDVRRLQDEGFPRLCYGPVFVRTDVDKGVVEQLRQELLAMKEQDAQSRQILLLFRIAGFEPAADADYDPLRELIRELDARPRPNNK